MTIAKKSSADLERRWAPPRSTKPRESSNGNIRTPYDHEVMGHTQKKEPKKHETPKNRKLAIGFGKWCFYHFGVYSY